MNRTQKIHEKYKEKFGSDYNRGDVSIVSEAILNSIGKNGNSNKIDLIKKYWQSVCKFLDNWQG